jgi:hypothetical protein
LGRCQHQNREGHDFQSCHPWPGKERLQPLR